MSINPSRIRNICSTGQSNKTHSQGGLNVRDIIDILQSIGIEPKRKDRRSLVTELCRQKRLGNVPGMPAAKTREVTEAKACAARDPKELIGISAAAPLGVRDAGIRPPASGAGASTGPAGPAGPRGPRGSRDPRGAQEEVNERILIGSGSSGNVYR